MIGDTMKLPTCARCQRQVDRTTRYDDPLSDAVKFVVECHGERETVTVSERVLRSMKPMDSLSFGVAFAPKPAGLGPVVP